MSRHLKDEGIVLAKKKLLRRDLLIIIFSKNQGRMVLKAYGVRKITSRRRSHLETANYLRFSAYRRSSYWHLAETELIYGYSRIKKSAEKLSWLFILLTMLNKILPENQSAPAVFAIVLSWLKKLNNDRQLSSETLLAGLKVILREEGYINEEQLKKPSFDPLRFVEELIGYPLKKVFFT